MKNWTKAGIDTLLKKLEETGSTDRKRGSGRPKMACTEENVSAVEELVLSQEDQPQSHDSHHSTRQIAQETDLAQASVGLVRIVHRDLGLKCFKRRRVKN